LLQQALQEAEKLPQGEPLSETLLQLAMFSEGAHNDQAEQYLKRALANNEKVWDPSSRQVSDVLASLASFYQGTQQPASAEPLRVRELRSAKR
jgi:hypothetical protein